MHSCIPFYERGRSNLPSPLQLEKRGWGTAGFGVVPVKAGGVGFGAWGRIDDQATGSSVQHCA